MLNCTNRNSVKISKSFSRQLHKQSLLFICWICLLLFLNCKHCGALGSVALVPGYGKPLETMGEEGLVMILKTSGYVPTNYHMVCNWIATKVTGQSFHVNDAGSKVYGTDDKEVVNLSKLNFSVKKVKKSDLP